MRVGLFIASCGAFVGALMPTAWAQTVAPVLPYNAGAASNQADEARQSAPRFVNAPPVLPHVVEPQLTLNEKETLFIRSIIVEGPNLVGESEVREILAPYENRKLTLALIYEAADKVTALFRNQGYLVAKAYVPAQDARSGVLRLKLVPGQYGAVTIRNESLVQDDYVKAVIDQALAGSPLIHKDELERAMMLINDLPGAGIPRVAIGAGRQQETSDFVFDVPEGRRLDGFLLADNYGPGYTARDRLSGGVNLNSPLGYGDRLQAYGLVSNHTNLVNGRVAYSAPIGYDGLRVEVAAFQTTYALAGKYADLDATGVAPGVTGTLTYAIRRQREDSIYISGAVTHKWVDDKTFGTSFAGRTVDFGTAAISRDTVGTLPLIGLALLTSTSFSLTAGYVNYPDPAQKALNVAGADSVGDYARLNLSFNATVLLAENLSLSAYLRAQKSLRGNLDVSEQIYVSGSTGVRSYDEGFAGDSGYIFTSELKYVLPEFQNYHHAVGLFTDVAAAWLENGTYTITQNSYTPLNDIGLGYYATYEYMPARSLLLRAQVAHTYGSDDSTIASRTYDRRTKGLVQIGFTF